MGNHGPNLTHPDIGAGLLSIALVTGKKSHEQIEPHLVQLDANRGNSLMENLRYAEFSC